MLCGGRGVRVHESHHLFGETLQLLVVGALRGKRCFWSREGCRGSPQLIGCRKRKLPRATDIVGHPVERVCTAEFLPLYNAILLHASCTRAQLELQAAHGNITLLWTVECKHTQTNQHEMHARLCALRRLHARAMMQQHWSRRRLEQTNEITFYNITHNKNTPTRRRQRDCARKSTHALMPQVLHPHHLTNPEKLLGLRSRVDAQ